MTQVYDEKKKFEDREAERIKERARINQKMQDDVEKGQQRTLL